MKNNSLHRNIVKAGVSVLLCLLLIVSALPTVGTARDIIGKAAPSLGSVLPIAKTGDAVNKKPIPVPSFCFTVQIPKIDISDAVGDDGHTYQKITMPDSPVTTKPIGGPQIPYLVKNVHIPDNAKDITIQVQTNGAPTVYQDILVYPCPQKIVKTDEIGRASCRERVCLYV